MYAMWWYKPLAPKEPFVLHGLWVKPLCAYMYMCSEMSGEINPRAVQSGTVVKSLLAFLRLYSKTPEIESMSLIRSDPFEKQVAMNSSRTDTAAPHEMILNSMNETTHCESAIASNDPSISAENELTPAPRACMDELRCLQLEKSAGTAFFERLPRVKDRHLDAKSVSLTALNRWQQAVLAIRRYPQIASQHILHSHHQGKCQHIRSQEYVAARIQNWPRDDLLRSVNGLVVGMVLWLACLAYGGIHLTAWNDHFPSIVEKWLWRSSSLYIGFCGGLWIVLNYATIAYKPLNVFWEKWMDRGGTWWQNITLGIPVFVCGLSLIFARAFIVVEAFISIRELPAAAYMTPTWTQVFPHF